MKATGGSVLKVATTDMKYFARSTFSKSLDHEKKIKIDMASGFLS